MGSSPLTRGKPLRVRPPRKHQGLIPAHAGKTDAARRAQHPSTAHPRSRGENAPPSCAFGACEGSSPLTRGKLTLEGLDVLVVGLIPAHAGKTVKPTPTPAPTPAHPRSRGENYISLRLNGHRGGSSPLTRGKRRRASTSSHARWAHPRSRGENNGGAPFTWAASGSSPLTRGKRRPLYPAHQGTRLIPAHAGKTSGSRAAHSQPWAHPRSRGENPRAERGQRDRRGSSPLTRGKLPPSPWPLRRLGLIPAHAGKTRPHRA